jgi:YggT family protein
MMMGIVDVVFGVLGLLLIIRVLLRIFNVGDRQPVMVVFTTVTDPVIAGACKLLGIPAYRYQYKPGGRREVDLFGSLVTLVLIWGLRTIIIWALQFARSVPFWIASPLSSIGSVLQFLLALVFDLYGLALFVRILFGWLRVPYTSPVMRFLWSITEPVLAPIRQVLPPFYGIDFSPLVVYFLLRLLRQVVFTMLSWIF